MAILPQIILNYLPSQSVFFNIVISAQATLLVILVYRFYFHPLANLPGPYLAKFTSLWLYYHTYNGIEGSTIQELHEKYGPVIRIGPNQVNINDGAAINAIYIKNGGLAKDPCYKNFDIDEVSTIFSARDHAHRASRAKAVAGMFAPQAIRDGKDKIDACVEKMAAKLEMARDNSAGNPVDVLMVFKALSLDIMSSYLFGRNYNGLDEEKLSARWFVDSFVAVGKWFYMPPWVMFAIDWWGGNYMHEEEMGATRLDLWQSLVAVDRFTMELANEAEKASDEEKADTYQGRLLAAGVSREETISQCKDLIFAGTDSTGTNLSTVAFQLAQNPRIYERLQEELASNSNADPQTLPYLSAVIKESLRIAMANPNRLPRIVGKEGLIVPGLCSLPSGTSVSVCLWSLHFNDKVFPDPHVYRPERWLEATPEMTRDNIAFGVGTRQCIARNLATFNLFAAVEAIVRKDLLKGAKTVEQGITVVQWFNSRIVGGKVELRWPDVKAIEPATESGAQAAIEA